MFIFIPLSFSSDKQTQNYNGLVVPQAVEEFAPETLPRPSKSSCMCYKLFCFCLSSCVWAVSYFVIRTETCYCSIKRWGPWWKSKKAICATKRTFQSDIRKGAVRQGDKGSLMILSSVASVIFEFSLTIFQHVQAFSIPMLQKCHSFQVSRFWLRHIYYLYVLCVFYRLSDVGAFL